MSDRREMDLKEEIAAESMLQLLIDRDDFDLPGESALGPPTSQQQAPQQQQPPPPPLPPPPPMPPNPCRYRSAEPPGGAGKHSKGEQFYHGSGGYGGAPSHPPNFFPQTFIPRHSRSQSSEFKPPHDFSNPIWEYFTLEEDKATCRVCGKRITYRSNAYVTNLVTHLRTRGIGHDTCYNLYMMKKNETNYKIRDEIALNYLLTNMASTVFGSQQTSRESSAK